MKKANIELLTDSYKYFMRLKPPAQEQDIKLSLRPDAGAVYVRKKANH